MSVVSSSSAPGGVPVGTFTATTPNLSTDQLLLLFAQASENNASAQKLIQNSMQNSIDTKNLINKVQQDIQGLSYDGNNIANAQDDKHTLKADLEAAIQNCTDPQVRAQLQQAHDTYFNQNDDDHKDTLLSRDEAGQLGKTLETTSASIDDGMQQLTFNLKAAGDKFQALTAAIKEIMDSNQAIISKIQSPSGQ